MQILEIGTDARALAKASEKECNPKGDARIHDASGKHLLLTLAGCKSAILNDMDALGDLTRKAAEATGATVLNMCVQPFAPQGVTAVAILAESHASLHTYPEANLVFWDCFTCGNTCEPEKSISVLQDALDADSVTFQVVARS